ncbi:MULTISPECIES: PRC and DUF2382 domain-containing protein [unclassified Allobranchiibius]|uniref:DUF2382 domain-containing protein n=1 Tax=unclassified Allobranchiibius TaxID=2649857 RepID=UPI001AA1CAD6|nr:MULTISPECIES: PRC and DUF2382 domain-containing protein [unclassified Allobranchiibius]MBO1766778.1 PRC and DUF2382 domain-containing protein [Allobranchiibius sp. GilTou38]UIJ33701.1 PRC and DUF2382 domain-containing protein [Allobranchiibius sp. GilTou73]
MISTEQIQTISGGNAVDSEGAKIGSIGQIYLDDQSGQPEWVTVKTGLFGTSETFIPIRDAEVDGNDLRLPYSKDKVKDAPRVSDADEHLDVEQEQKLYEYYGLAYGTSSTGGNGHDDVVGGRGTVQDGVQDSDHEHEREREHDDRRDRAGEPGVVGRDTSGPTTDDAMTRSEERLNVGTEKVETGRARLRKYVVTENVTTTVPVSHEEVRVVREPITEANRGDALSGGDLTEEEHEVTLHAEQPVVQKETVPVERVKLDTETVSGEQEVTEQVRKEQIETDTGEGNEPRRDNNNR